ncbi:hypothetical protein [Streptomyces sp. KL116D]|uniref:hypothetical protein n=1 Tax=Streptomyces sp. KL116D TaxID=3045152 RepID=UPI0035571EA9
MPWCQVLHGGGMLVHQAAESFRLFTGCEPHYSQHAGRLRRPDGGGRGTFLTERRVPRVADVHGPAPSKPGAVRRRSRLAVGQRGCRHRH